VERWRRSETTKERETQIVEQIESLMMYRREMPEEGKLRELIRPVAAEAQKEAREERWIDIQEKCPKECESVHGYLVLGRNSPTSDYVWSLCSRSGEDYLVSRLDVRSNSSYSLDAFTGTTPPPSA